MRGAKDRANHFEKLFPDIQKTQSFKCDHCRFTACSISQLQNHISTVHLNLEKIKPKSSVIQKAHPKVKRFKCE